MHVILFQPFIEFWHKHRCPQCSAVNWTYHSHSQRQEPVFDPNVCRCHACNARYWMLEESLVRDTYPDEDLDECGDEAIGRDRPA